MIKVKVCHTKHCYIGTTPIYWYCLNNISSLNKHLIGKNIIKF